MFDNAVNVLPGGVLLLPKTNAHVVAGGFPGVINKHRNVITANPTLVAALTRDGGGEGWTNIILLLLLLLLK